MEKVISTEKVPIKMWLNDIEEGALEQAKNLANLPFVFKHVALMPDSHQGFGMPIGAVLATKGVISCNCVGVDIGCGMCAIKTPIKNILKDDLKLIMGLIRKRIPVGFFWNKDKQPENLMPQLSEKTPICERYYDEGLFQIGSLGGGNHFIELQSDNDGFLWVMIHSGSRNIGKNVADYYHKEAVKLVEKWYSNIPTKELAFLPFNDTIGQEYFAEMNFCVEFALQNRMLMMNKILGCIAEILKVDSYGDNNIINIAHNYAKIEHHFDSDVIVHRKGATSAKLGEIGIIPGSQGTKSYIVEGLGNHESFMSCSHGAGRKMGRKQAKLNLNLEDEINKMNKLGIVHGIRTIDDLDEAPGSYKDINIVMSNQLDLVKILVELSPLGVIKG